MSIFAVIPALNEEKTIANVICSLQGIVDKIIIVNDCSSDNTASISRDNGACVIDNNTNLGYSKSLDKGILAALNDDASVVLTIDADGQHPIDKGEKMISLINDFGYHVVLGTRDSFPRYSEKLFSVYSKYRYDLPDLLCGMKCYSRHALVATGVSSKWNSLGTYITIKSLQEGLKVKAIDVNVLDRKDSESRFGKSLRGEIPILRALFQIIVGTL